MVDLFAAAWIPISRMPSRTSGYIGPDAFVGDTGRPVRIAAGEWHLSTAGIVHGRPAGDALFRLYHHEGNAWTVVVPAGTGVEPAGDERTFRSEEECRALGRDPAIATHTEFFMLPATVDGWVERDLGGDPAILASQAFPEPKRLFDSLQTWTASRRQNHGDLLGWRMRGPGEIVLLVPEGADPQGYPGHLWGVPHPLLILPLAENARPTARRLAHAVPAGHPTALRVTPR